MDGWPTSREGPPQDGYVFLEWIRDDHDGGIRHNHAVLKEGHGMMIFCRDCPPGQEYPTAEFKLFASDGALVQTMDMAELKRALSQIPAGETILLINTCGGGTHYGLNPAVLDAIESFCRCRGIKFVSAEGGICVCA